MKEITFLKRNANKWREMENFLDRSSYRDPDAMANLFVELTDDLSYARTFYPGSETVAYLNGLAVQLHQEIYRNKRESSSKIWRFFSYDLPLLYFKHWKVMLFVLLFTFVGSLIAIVSQRYDPTFADLILGPGYVDMTIQNIENGDPMGVYKGDNQFWMFVRIASNNIVVMLKCYALGLLFSVGSLYMIFLNAIMLGSFYYLFYHYGGVEEWWTHVWLHGTLEIWSMILGGTAGVVMGNSILFPKSYSRGASLAKGAREGMKMVLGCIPLLLVAGFIEGFVTRLTNMPDWVNLLIIFGSLFFIVFYFLVYPWYLNHKMKQAIAPEGEVMLTFIEKLLLTVAMVITLPLSLLFAQKYLSLITYKPRES